MLCRRCTRKALRDTTIPFFHDPSEIGLRGGRQRKRRAAELQREVPTQYRTVMLWWATVFLGSAVSLIPQLSPHPLPWGTLSVLLVVCGVSLYTFRQDSIAKKSRTDAETFTDVYAYDSERISLIGQRWRLVSGDFLHANVLHLGLNVWGLWEFGRAVESTLEAYAGRAAAILFALLYFTISLLCHLGALVASRHNRIRAVGASGTTLGLLSVWVVDNPTSKLAVMGFVMPSWVFLAAFTTLSLLAALRRGSTVDTALSWPFPRVDHVGHLSGIAVGCVFGVALLLR